MGAMSFEELPDFDDAGDAKVDASVSTAEAGGKEKSTDVDKKADGEEAQKAVVQTKKAEAPADGDKTVIHSSGFRDFLLKPELLRSIKENGFEHPSEVQHQSLPQALLGTDILCQAKSGMGKTAVFVLSCLQQVETDESCVRALIIAHTRELVYQIRNEFDRFSKTLPAVKIDSVFGGTAFGVDKDKVSKDPPHILIGSPGRICGLLREEALKVDKLKMFVVDECDKCVDKLDMRKDIQFIFSYLPKVKQVMMFSATFTDDSREVCKKLMKDPFEIRVEEDSKLTLHGLLQYYVKCSEGEKNRKLNDILDKLEFNQVVIFVKSVHRAIVLNRLLEECNFPSITIHSHLSQEDRIARYKEFKAFEKRIMVATDLFGRGIDIERVNIVVNYDMTEETDSYLHRVGRAGRFGTKGLAISFVTTEEDTTTLKGIQDRFGVEVEEMPSEINTSFYLNA